MQILFRKEDIRDQLGVSLATVNNWIRTGMIPSPDIFDQYSQDKFSNIISSIKNSNSKLIGRANRSQLDVKLISYLGITDKKRKKLLEKAISVFEDSGFTILEGVIALSITLLKSNNIWDKSSEVYKILINQLPDSDNALKIEGLFDSLVIKNEDDDFLGAFYQSIQSISAKSNLGSYYTPSELLKEIKVPINAKVIDPCCGSGGILLRVIDKNHDPRLIWARDIDKTALFICHINLVLFFNDPCIKPNIEYQDIVFADYSNLFSSCKGEYFDFVITNPPWGSKLSKLQKDFLIKMYPELQTGEVFSISLFNGLKMLSQNGVLFYFLPYSFLNVATHKNIRKHILQGNCNISIKILGNAFKGVLSESLLLRIDNSQESVNKLYIENKFGEKYLIERTKIKSPDYLIPATATNNDNEILNKIYSVKHCTLSSDCIFALGVVTGNNEKYILTDRTEQSEPIYRGKDIQPYRLSAPECFIEFTPEIYQQVAPVKYYRSKKIIYRFISDKIVCVLDEDNSLILNSANLFIPKNYPMKTIVCLFNSCIYSFIYKKKFHSKKVLKSHLQNFPLPILSEEQHFHFHNLFCQIKKNQIDQAKIDDYICELFMLNKEEYKYIWETVYGNS